MSNPKRPCSPSPPPPLNTTKRPRQRTPIRFLILSDTHSATLPSPLPTCDVVLHCGDLTKTGTPSSLSTALQSLGQIPASLILAIAGNHDISLDRAYYLSEGGLATDADLAQTLISRTPDSVASLNNVTFLNEGTHTFTLPCGASFRIYASPYTPAYGRSAFQYPPCSDRFNPVACTPPWAVNVGTAASVIPEGVDIVMTHGPAKYILDSVDGTSTGCEHLRRAVGRVRPRLFCAGHVHGGYGEQRLCFRETRMSHSESHPNCGGVGAEGEEGDPILPQPQEWVGRNQARRKGYAALAPGSMDLFRRGGETLAVNAALWGELSDEEGEEGLVNVPWLVELEL